MKDGLEDIARRLDRLASGGPGAPRIWERVARPVLRRLYARPHIETRAIRQLVRTPDQGELASAVRELASGVAEVERSARLTRRVPMAELHWLWRLYQIVYRARQLIGTVPASFTRQVLAGAVESHQLLPLTDPTAGPAAVAIDPVLDAAHHEFRRLGRKRRLLEAARQLLLEAAAAGTVDAAAARCRRMDISRELARLDRLQAAGIAPEVDLLYQLEQAHAHGDLQRLAASLTALERQAVDAGEDQLARLAGQALEELWRGGDRYSDQAKAASLARSQQQLFGAEVRERIQAGYRRATASIPGLRKRWKDELDDEFFVHLDRYLAGEPTDHTLAAAIAVDGSFELGAAVSPVRALEVNQRLIAVPHPTQDLALAPAQGVSDLPQALIDDPRTVLAGLAAGTLMTRRYLAVETVTTQRQGLRNDARIYVLDGSGSMLGPRSRMRDALLVNELVTLAARLQDPQRAGQPVLYFCYFDLEVGPVRRIATAEEAHQAIEDIIATVRAGGTDIQKALVSSFDQLRQARQRDPDLVRAQVVLVTDGESNIDQAEVEKARAAVGQLPIGLSIIALGQENAALRELAAAQRARGERVFYQFMADSELRAVERGETAGLPIHLPAVQGAAALSQELSAVMKEIEQRGRRLEVPDREYASVLESAMSELGISLASDFSEAARARHEVLLKDETTLRNRFSRWFPIPPPGPPSPITAQEQDQLDELARLLETVAEVVKMGHAHPLEQRADAIEMMERLLRETGMAPWRYAELLRRHAARVGRSLAAVHAAAGELVS
jgi:hypothetical protein